MYNIGFSYLRMGWTDMARNIYREAVELFGAQSGVETQVPVNLRWLNGENRNADVAREILSLYWE
jgi:Flp pilus assembly protein TadD